MEKEITLREHLKQIARKRWEKRTAEEKKAHAAMMLAKRWGKKDK